ncbi:MAG TPA: ABC transporter substrate-binding protein [Candidatus Limnocylindria bacterium]|nr:ABC transporter substrate-binding protein [Candidatus Limnocylindria bacterium]
MLVAGACASAPPARRDVVVGLLGEPQSVFSSEPGARFLAGAVTESLVRRDARDEFVPRLAEAVPTLENGGLRVVVDDPLTPGGRLEATFRLRANARWQDGQAITASDVRFAWESDRNAPAGTDARFVADRVVNILVLDDRTAMLVYAANERWLDYPLAPHVLPRHWLAGLLPAQRAAYDREPMHAGPFAVAAWLPGLGVTLSAFKDYVGGPPRLGRIEVRFLPSRAAILDALRRGDVDVAASSALEADLTRTLDQFADGAKLATYYVQTEAMNVLRFGANATRFGDPRVRAAVALAIDRQSIVDDVFAGRARVPQGYLVAPLWAASSGAAPRHPDRETGRALLAAAGFLRGPFGIVERGGDRMIVTITVADGSAARVDVARRAAGDLAAVGIAAEVRERPLGEVQAGVARGDVDLAVVPESASDPQSASARYLGMAGPWFDVLAAAAARAPDRADKAILYAELQRVWLEALPALPLYQELTVDVAPRALTGVRPTPAGAPLSWNVAEWAYAGR